MESLDSFSDWEYSGTLPFTITDPVLSNIGNTPLFPYEERSLSGTVKIKAEYENPTGSMKDRIAVGMLKELEENGEIEPGDLVVEGSSGNTAGAVALAANRLGYECVITTPVGNSEQKLGYVESLGGELITCPDVPTEHKEYYRNKAKRVATERGGVWLDQYSNQTNPTVHSVWTGPELVDQYPELTHVVCPMGTGGTMSGIAKYIKEEHNSDVTAIGVDAVESNVSTAFYGHEEGNTTLRLRASAKVTNYRRCGSTTSTKFEAFPIAMRSCRRDARRASMVF
ncbi:pyridoxal-phosphate dependent enzyme [Haloarculaceae archaeon H-GB11]|nr:pyridoxal-phosphate dependent enzyme [Haloarculaceae archaeon H-GB11]